MFSRAAEVPGPDHSLRMVVPDVDVGAMALAEARQARLTKPSGSLGQLEVMAIRMAAIFGAAPDQYAKRVLVFAADHGAARHGVSAFPQEVTAQMLRNFDGEGAAINAVAASVGASLTVVDVGVIEPPVALNRVRSRSIRPGTRDFTTGPALTETEVRRAMEVGATEVDAIPKGFCVLALGEMGIANTTSSAAITSVMCSRSVAESTGPGTGLSSDGVRRKVRLIETALRVNVANAGDPLGVLVKVGGLETAALVGAMIRAAQLRMPVVIDGFTVGAAALVAEGMVPGLRRFLFAGHLSTEPGHALQLRHLGLDPILALQMRLGEGTGATLAIAVLDAAWAAHTRMLTFEEAGVDERHP